MKCPRGLAWAVSESRQWSGCISQKNWSSKPLCGARKAGESDRAGGLGQEGMVRAWTEGLWRSGGPGTLSESSGLHLGSNGAWSRLPGKALHGSGLCFHNSPRQQEGCEAKAVPADTHGARFLGGL